MKIIWFIGLSLAAWEDLRERRVSLWILQGLGIFGIWNVWKIWQLGAQEIFLHMAAAGLALLILLFSKITRGAIGAGDGLFYLVSACYLTIRESAVLFLGSLGICCIWAMILVLKREMKQTIPFLVCSWPVGLWLLCLP